MLDLDDPDTERAAAADPLLEYGAPFGGQFLGIVEACGSLLAQHHRGRHNGARQWTAARLVDPDDELARGEAGGKIARGSSGQHA